MEDEVQILIIDPVNKVFSRGMIGVRATHEYMNNNAKALKSGFWYTFANFAVKAMALITTPLFTRLLTKKQFGDYSNWFSWAGIAVIIISMSMESSLISAKFDYENSLDRYNLSLISLTLVSTAIWTCIINIFSVFFSNLLGLKIAYMNLILIYCFFYETVNIFQMSERFQYRYKRAVFIALLVSVSTAILSVLLVLNMQDRLTGRILGTVIPPSVIGVFIVFYFIKNGNGIDFTVWKYALKICIPFVPHLLSLTFLNSVDRIMITRICGAEDNAMYSVAYTCGHMVTILLTSLNGAFSPWLGDKLHEKKFDEIKKISKYYIGMFCVLAVGLMLLAPEILLIMGGHRYLEAKYVMTPVAMGCVCQFLYTLFVNIEQYMKKTVGMAFASVSAALLNYILNAIFIPQYGYYAAAYTTLAGFLFLLLVHMLLVKKLGYGQVYSYSFVGLITLIMMIITMGVNLLYGYITIRYITIIVFIAILGFFCVKKIDKIKFLVRTIITKS